MKRKSLNKFSLRTSKIGKAKREIVTKKTFLKASIMLLLLGGAGVAMAQQEKPDSAGVWQKIQDNKAVNLGGKKIEITQSFQLWDVHTLETLGEQASESRNDLYVRRGRLGVKGNIIKDLSFNIAFAYDGIGRDKKTAGNGSPNPDDNHDFFLWEAFTMWNYRPLLNITTGYFRPQVGREHMTAAFKTSSFEKSLSNFQPRTHFVARSTGREMGLNLGGLHKRTGWSLNYNVGLFDITGEKLMGEGTKWFPLIASRLAFTLGDPEMEKYGIGYTHSYYGERKGVTFGVNSTYQGETEMFKSNSFYGGDILVNWGPFDFTVEHDWLYRNSVLKAPDQTPEEPYKPLEKLTEQTSDQVFTYKLGYNFLLRNGKILQAAAMYSGQLANDYGDIPRLNALTGASDQDVYDVGLNYLINNDNLKLNMHYVWGERKDKGLGSRYAYLGSGLQFLF